MYSVLNMEAGADQVVIMVNYPDAATVQFRARVCIDTPTEWSYYLNGGILPYVVRRLSKDI